MFQLPSRGVNPLDALRSTLSLGGASWPLRLGEWLGERLIPPHCVFCDAPGLPGPLDLCAGCLADLPLRDAPVPAAATHFELLCCPYAFAWPVDGCVRGLKFRGERSHGRLLGELLGRARRAQGPPWPALVVPVPLHPLRLAERGYNQAAELARHAARVLDLRCRPRAVARIRATRPQSGLGAAERAANPGAAFAARQSFAGLRVALIDDVVTTGNTAAAAAAALRAAGAAQLELWAVAGVRRRDAGPAACL
jgi:ComF family protein